MENWSHSDVTWKPKTIYDIIYGLYEQHTFKFNLLSTTVITRQRGHVPTF